MHRKYRLQTKTGKTAQTNTLVDFDERTTEEDFFTKEALLLMIDLIIKVKIDL